MRILLALACIALTVALGSGVAVADTGVQSSIDSEHPDRCEELFGEQFPELGGPLIGENCENIGGPLIG